VNSIPSYPDILHIRLGTTKAGGHRLRVLLLLQGSRILADSTLLLHIEEVVTSLLVVLAALAATLSRTDADNHD